MRFARTLAARSLLGRPGRTLFSVLGVALGIVTSVGVFTLDHNTVVGMSMRGADQWRPALEVRPSHTIPDPRGALLEIPGVAGVAAVFQEDARLRLPESTAPGGERAGPGGAARGGARGAGGSEDVRLIAIDAQALPELEAVRLVAGRTLAPGAARAEALIGSQLADALGLEVGARFLLSRPVRGPRSDCVDGKLVVVEDAPLEVVPELEVEVAGILAHERLGRRARGRVVVVDHARGLELFEGAQARRGPQRFWVRQGRDVDLENLRADLGRSFSYELEKSVLVGAAADERAFRNGVRMAGLLALVLGLYVIFHTLSMSLVERVREVATLHALGASRAQIGRVFLIEALIVSGLAGLLGLAGGIGLAYALARAGVTTLGSGHRFPQFSIPWGEASALTALGVGVALVGSVYPLARARRADTVQALRGEAALRGGELERGFHLFAATLLVVLLPAIYFAIVPVLGTPAAPLVGAVLGGVAFLALLVVLPLLVPALLGRACVLAARPFERFSPFVGRQAAVAMRSGPARVAVASAAIALVAASFVGLRGMTASLAREIEQWAELAIVDKVYARELPSVPLASLTEALHRRPEVLAVESGTLRTYVPFLLLGMDPAELARAGPAARDERVREMLAAGRGLILSTRLARHLGYELGDTVQVGTASGVEALEVLAISDENGYFPFPDERLYGVTGAAFHERAFCFDGGVTTQIAVRLRPGADPSVVEEVLAEALPEVEPRFWRGRGLLFAHLADLAKDFRLFDVILGLTALLAGLGVLNGQLLAALERSKELGILRALGASRAQIGATLLVESAVVGLAGGLAGTALGALLTPVLVRALAALSGLDLPHASAGSWLVLVPLGAVVVSLLASLYPVARAGNLDPVVAVRTG